MATIKISAMTPALNMGGADLIPIVQGGVNKQAPLSLLAGYTNHFLAGITALGSTAKGFTLCGFGKPGDSTVTLVDGRCQMVAAYIAKPGVITGVRYNQITQGNYTADNNNRIGLYTVAGGVLTLVASSANDGNLWKAATNSMNTVPFSAPYSAVVGVYYIGYVHNSSAQVTAPSIAGHQLSVGGQLLDLANSNSLSAYVAATDIVPNGTLMSAIVGVIASPAFFILY